MMMMIVDKTESIDRREICVQYKQVNTPIMFTCTREILWIPIEG
jgi:hypothetical protein